MVSTQFATIPAPRSGPPLLEEGLLLSGHRLHKSPVHLLQARHATARVSRLVGLWGRGGEDGRDGWGWGWGGGGWDRGGKLVGSDCILSLTQRSESLFAVLAQLLALAT